MKLSVLQVKQAVSLTEDTKFSSFRRDVSINFMNAFRSNVPFLYP